MRPVDSRLSSGSVFSSFLSSFFFLFKVKLIYWSRLHDYYSSKITSLKFNKICPEQVGFVAVWELQQNPG